MKKELSIDGHKGSRIFQSNQPCHRVINISRRLVFNSFLSKRHIVLNALVKIDIDFQEYL